MRRPPRGRLAPLDRHRDLDRFVRERELAAQIKMAWFDAQTPAARGALRFTRHEREIPPDFLVAELHRLGAMDAQGQPRLPELPHID